MTIEQQAIRGNQLINRLVIDRHTAEEIGRVEQLWLDPQAHRILGFTCKSGIFSNKKRAFTWADIYSIGTDSIVINNPPAAEEPEKPPQVTSLINREVFTDTGNKVGKLVDFLLLPQTGIVVNYLYSSNGWRGVLDGIYMFAPADITSIGSKRVMVADAAIQVPQKYSEGITQILKEDYYKTKHDLEKLKRNAQTLAEQAREKVQDLREQAQERAQTLAEQAREKYKNVREQAQERAQTLAEQAREWVQIFAEQAKEKVQEVRKAKEKNAEAEEN
ncbi:MAG: PRC-barrel domain-containing protein [Oscillatoriaceae bacterium SKW80]|nr:PRC-barrel domain-containing protein [Oscillatoriaceae bacterium SKYG93]MCX8120763.1 PRC-barrel domain-containing protein [Oscillatoriaceae bacterium SKW80]MDW8452128.1 PRC-barrel domain-containing protein [Oscillatoriaceae cyanobacterium SKYGB_i_bin93]HIK27776.1 PRC-barrel domain-containing protein [Oscillatoriaceae cyanobacterium M7585_C2015_266]